MSQAENNFTYLNDMIRWEGPMSLEDKNKD